MIYKNTTDTVSIKINTSRFDHNFEKAQKKLDRLVLGQSTPYVPFREGHLRSSGHIVHDGLLEWNEPYAHYMYMGELYLTENGSSWAHKYEQKYPAGIDLQYHEPNTGARWVDKAKQVHGSEWINTVKRIAGGGV